MDNLLKFVVKYTTSVREVKCVNCQKHMEVIAALLVMHCYLVLGTNFHKMLVWMATREDPDQTASSEAVWYGSELFVWQLVFENFKHLRNQWNCCCEDVGDRVVGDVNLRCKAWHKFHNKKVIESDQKIPQSHSAYLPMAQ